MIRYLKDRLQEPSTVRGLVWLAMACGVQIEQAHINDVITVCAAIAGLLGAILPDK